VVEGFLVSEPKLGLRQFRPNLAALSPEKSCHSEHRPGANAPASRGICFTRPLPESFSQISRSSLLQEEI
jgi:hypothetical protein